MWKMAMRLRSRLGLVAREMVKELDLENVQVSFCQPMDLNDSVFCIFV
jgi:hypothetical protein